MPRLRVVRTDKLTVESWRRVGTVPTRMQKQRHRISLGGQHARRRISALRREAIFERDGYRCVECGEIRRRKLTIDHRIPLAHGGTNEDENLQTMCKECNNRKGDSLPP